MSKDFKLIKKFTGYQNKKDVSNTDAHSLVVGSHDVLINDGEKIVTRKGYSLDGDASSDLFPIESSYDWDTSGGTTHHLRSFDDKLQFRYVDADGVVSWNTLMEGFTGVKFRYDSWWDSSEVKDLLLFVNGTSNIYMWSGAVATVSSNNATTLTKSGSETWAESRFLLAGTRKVLINGVEYAYTGGETTTTLTGLSGLPAFTAGDLVVQAVRTTANTPAAAVDNDIIFVAKNQVYIADEQRRDVYISSNTDFTDYTPSSPRLPGEGAVLTLDSCPTAIIDQEDAVYISAGKNDWYQVVFTLSSDLTNETVSIQKLKSGPQQASKSQELTGKIKNSVIFISQEPTLDTLGRLENINTPQSNPLSDPVKLDFNNYDFTNGHVKYFKNQTLIAVPAEGLVLIYDHANGYWQPPQNLPVSRFAIIDGEIYGHSSAVSETYKIFDPEVQNDNGNAINHVAIFAYRNFDNRSWRKRFDEYFHEGYIANNTTITVNYKYEFGGSRGEKEKFIDTSVANTIFNTNPDNSLGKNPLGHEPLGTIIAPPADLNKFRNIHTLNKMPSFFEFLLTYSSYEIDYEWQILAHGGNAILSTADNVDIKT